MKQFKTYGMLVAMLLLFSACASNPGRTGWYQDWYKCAALGGAVGAGAGAVADDDAAIAGAVGGAVIGGLVCAMGDTDADGVKNHKDDCPGTEAGVTVDSMGCEVATDNDGDGVVNSLDECPGTPSGAPVDARGCELDGDNDGVVDRLDRCLRTPAGTAVGARGCALDSDGDGVVDGQDNCPNTPQGTPVDNAGCTLAEVVELEGVYFELDSAMLTRDSTSILDGVVRILKRHPDMAVEIAGHTDSQGNAQYNQGLSERRVHAVRDYLIANGVNGANISARGYGESQPVANNTTKAGRAANRRVELRQK